MSRLSKLENETKKINKRYNFMYWGKYHEKNNFLQL